MPTGPDDLLTRRTAWPDSGRVSAYRVAHRFRSRIWPILLLLIIAATFADLFIPPLAGLPFGLRIALIVAAALGLLAWLAFPAWYHAGFRGAAWDLARAKGRAWHWLSRDWRGFVLLVAIVVLLAQLRYVVAGQGWNFAPLLEFRFWLATVTIVIGYYALRAAVQSRRRLVIVSFEDFTGNAQLAAGVKGAATRLASELVRLAGLYRVIDEMRSEGQSPGAYSPAPMSVEQDSWQNLQGAISAESVISLGPVKIPVGSLVALTGRLMQGPRLTGSLHQEGTELQLTCRVSGSAQGSWVVTSRDIAHYPDAGGDGPLGQMLNQMVYRVFTSLTDVGSQKWLAVRHYSHGLVCYRDRLRSGHDRYPDLRAAEAWFVKALDEDRSFARCHYNLGVVYTKLGEPESADAVLQRAMVEDPRHYETRYALALNCQEQARADRYQSVIDHCEQAIRLRPADARAWSLLGFALRKRDIPENANKQDPDIVRAWTRVIRVRDVATALAWRSLCARALVVGDCRSRIETAALCTRNLAVACTMNSRRRALRLYRQAAALAPGDAGILVELGKELIERDSWNRAEEVLRRALRVEDRVDGWTYLAHVQVQRVPEPRPGDSPAAQAAALASERAALDSCARAFNFASQDGNNDEFRRLDEALALLLSRSAQRSLPTGTPLHASAEGVERDARRFRAALDCRRQLARQPGETEAQHDARLATLRRELEANNPPTPRWVRARVMAETGFRALPAAPDTAVAELEEALEIMADHYPGEVVNLGLHGQMARALVATGSEEDLPRALYHAERAVALAPESAWERHVLASVYWQLNDFDRAETQLAICLSLEPGDVVLQNIAGLNLSRDTACETAAGWQALLQRAIRYFERALSIMESRRPGTEDEARDLMVGQGVIHHRLGRLLRQARRHREAVGHHLNTAARTAKPLEARVELIGTYFEAGAWDEVEKTFEDLHGLALGRYESTEEGTKPIPGTREDRPVNAILDEAFIYSALALAESGTRLALAGARIRAAGHITTRLTEADRAANWAGCYEALGWVRYRQRNYAKAALTLERSVARRADPAACYRLAASYLKLAEADQAAGDHWREQAREALRQSRRLDLSGAFDIRNDELEAALASATKAKRT